MSKTSAKITMLFDEGTTLVEWGAAEIVSANLVTEVHPCSVNLPISELVLKVFTTDSRFSAFDDGAFYSQLTELMPMKLYLVRDNIEFFVGNFYLDTWKSPKVNQFEFTAVDLIGLLEKNTYDGGFWEVLTPISEILGSILNQYNIVFDVSGYVEDVTLKGWIPPGTVRSAIQQVAIAARALVRPTTMGSLSFSEAPIPLNNLPSMIWLRPSDKVDRQQINVNPLVTSFELISHEYSSGGTSEVIYEADLEPGDYKIVFNKPYYNVTTTGVGYIPVNLAANNGDLLVTNDLTELVVSAGYVYGPNYLLLSVYPPGGHVTVSGYPWIDSKRAHIYRAGGLRPHQPRNDLKMEEATLISLNNAPDVLNALVSYYGQPYNQEVETFQVIHDRVPVVYYGECPPYGSGYYVDADGVEAFFQILSGHVATISALGGNNIVGPIEKAEFDITGGLLCKIRTRGVKE